MTYQGTHKAKVESAVLVAQRWIVARLRNHTFFSLAQMNQVIAALLVELNDRPMRALGRSRRQGFEQLDRPALSALPLSATNWRAGRRYG